MDFPEARSLEPEAAERQAEELRKTSSDLLAGLTDIDALSIGDQMACHAILTMEAAAAVMEEAADQLPRVQEPGLQQAPEAVRSEGGSLDLLRLGSLAASMRGVSSL